jgi:hypothetical protein
MYVDTDARHELARWSPSGQIHGMANTSTVDDTRPAAGKGGAARSSRSGTRWTGTDRQIRGQKRLQVWLPEHLLERLDEMADHLGYSRTELLAIVLTCEYSDFKKSPYKWVRQLEKR